MQDPNRYLIWKTWHGGLNNDRMSLEIAVVMCRVLDRTLVLPDRFRLYLSGMTLLTDYFDREHIYKAVRTIEYSEFRKRFPVVGDDYAGVKQLEDVVEVDPGKIEMLSYVMCVPNCPKVGDHDYEDYKDFNSNREEWDISDWEANNHKFMYFREHKLFHYFYVFFYFRDLALKRSTIRLVRDHIHYRNDILHYASIIIRAMREDLEKNGQPLLYNSIHFRRGDFQYQDQRHLDPNVIVDNLREIFSTTGVNTLYIGTDERIRSNLKPFDDAYKVYIFDDFKHLLPDYVPTYYYGPIDQLVMSQGVIFVSTLLSTFSSYVTRMRGLNPLIENKRTYFTNQKYLSIEEGDQVERTQRYSHMGKWR